MNFIARVVNRRGSALVTDEYGAYRNAHRLMLHAVINHTTDYVHPRNANIHINIIEGFWPLLKWAWYGSHHKYAKGWSPLFVAEAVWKYNHRKDADSFNGLLRSCFA